MKFKEGLINYIGGLITGFYVVGFFGLIPGSIMMVIVTIKGWTEKGILTLLPLLLVAGGSGIIFLVAKYLDKIMKKIVGSPPEKRKGFQLITFICGIISGIIISVLVLGLVIVYGKKLSS